MKIILTHFESFLEHKPNPSQILSARVQDELENMGFQVYSIELPVSFKRAVSRILSLNVDGDIALMLGLNPKTYYITIEVVALNIMYSTKPDNDGYKPKGEEVVRGGPLAYKTNIDAYSLYDILRRKYPILLSHHAGTYVCNAAYYAMLHRVYSQKLKTKVLFLHIPYISEYALNKTKYPSLPLDYQAKIILDVVSGIVKLSIES